MTGTAASATSIENLTLNITQEVHVRASLEATFAALLDQIGPHNETHDGKPMPMKIEPWPGGRWYRDLGENNGHFWANVQAIKRPTLLEFSGPLFASFPFVSNVQYRLSEKGGGTLITFRHTGFGLLEDHHREGVDKGWASMLERIRKAAEVSLSRSATGQRSH
jgi:Activator of Hsp90 ATPase homolog 1-like protein